MDVYRSAMSTFTIKKDALGYYWGHLLIEKYTHTTHKVFKKEAKEWAEKNSYQEVLTTVDLEKIKFMKWLGFTKLRRVMTVDGIKQIMRLDTKCYK